MADRYWVGGAGTWDATTTTNWSDTSGGAGGASAPTSIDNVIFDSASNATLYTVTVGTNAVCNDLTVAGPASGNVTFSLTATSRLDPYGSMTLPASGLVWTGVSGALVTFRATTTGKTVTTNGVTLSGTLVTFNGVGGEWTLGSAITLNQNTVNTLHVISGTFNTANFNVTTISLGSTGDLSRTINLGSSTIVASSTTGSINFTGTNLTFNAGTSQINITSSTGGSIIGNGQTFYNATFTSAGAGTSAITGANTFNDLTQTSRSGTGVRTFNLHNNQIVNGTLTLGAANTSIRRIQVQSDIIGTQRTITLNGTLATLADVDFRNIAIAGSVGTWAGTRLGNGLGNNGITFDAAKDVYWNLTAGGTWVATAWALSSGGAVDANNFPLAQDKVIIEDTGLDSGTTVQFVSSSYWIGELDISTRTLPMIFASFNLIGFIYKNVTLSSAVTMTGTTAWQFVGQDTTQILDTNTATFVPPITINSGTGTLQLAENTTCSATVTLTSGTLDLNNFNLTCNIFAYGSTFTRAIAFGTGVVNVTGTAITVLSCSNGSGFSYTGTPRFNAIGAGVGGQTRTLNLAQAGITEANAVDVYVTAGADAIATSGTGFFMRTLDFTGFSGTFNRATFTSQFGNLVLGSGMTVNSSVNVLTLAATSGTQQITTNGVTLDFPITQNGVGGTVQLQDNLTMGVTRTYTLSNGTLDLDDNTLTTGVFSSNNVNIRSIAFGTGNITITGSGTVWVIGVPANFSRTGTPTVNISNNSATATTVTTGALTEAQSLDFNYTTGTYALTDTNAVYRSVNFTGFAGTITNTARTIYGSYTLSAGMTLPSTVNITTFAATSGTQQITTAGQTIDFPIVFNGIGGTFAFQDALTQGSTRAFTITNGTVQLKDGVTSTVGVFTTSGTNQKFLQSTLAGTQATISRESGQINVQYLDIKDSNATGGAGFNAAHTTNINSGNNTGWVFRSSNYFLLF